MFLQLSFIGYFLKYMKDEVKIYDKLDKKIIRKFTISTILKNELIFYITNNIKIYYFLLFMSPLFL